MNDKLLSTFFKIETTHWWWVGRKHIVLALLKKYLSTQKNRILDAGCGTGAGIVYLQKFGKVYGVDLSPIAVHFCKKRGIKNVKIGDVTSLPYDNNFFDLVCLMDVIEHIKDDSMVVKELWRVLKPGGILLMTLPALPSIFSEHDRAQGHFRRYTRKQLRALLKKNGFQEIRTSYFNTLLSPLIIVIRALSKLGGPFAGLADLDSQLNYDISKKAVINVLLTKIFSFESILLRFADIPFGISLLTLHRKN